MTSINVITAPDVLHNQALSFLLVQPSKDVREQFQKLIEHIELPMNVYLYDPQNNEERDIAWLLNIARLADFVVLDLDNLTTIEKNFASYLISLPNTFYLTNDNLTPYNKISVNRIYNLDWLYEKIQQRRGTNESL